MERKRRQKRYRRLDRAERAAIQNGLERGWSCRRMARELGRSPSTVADEVARNRTVAKGPGKGERVRGVPDDACPKLLSWPRCCNGCRNLRYRCCRRWRCEYSAARAQALADAELRESRCLCQAGNEQSGTRNLSSLADGLVKRSPSRASAPHPCGGSIPRTR